ncbi:Os07g0613800, partial [Oryza sativa Japonica Group]
VSPEQQTPARRRRLVAWSLKVPAMELEVGEETEEVGVEVACECCGLTEECTAPYIAGVRARYEGRWICGLCGDAVGEELGRASPPISPAEALDRHAFVCGAGRRSTAPPSPAESADDLISALRHLLRRRLGSPPLPPPRKVRSTPSSPRRDVPTSATAIVSVDTGGGGGAGGALARTESCFAALVE